MISRWDVVKIIISISLCTLTHIVETTSLLGAQEPCYYWPWCKLDFNSRKNHALFNSINYNTLFHPKFRQLFPSDHNFTYLLTGQGRMGDICGGQEEFLNVTHFWSSDNPRLPQCFSRSVLTIIPAIVIIINWIQVSN